VIVRLFNEAFELHNAHGEKCLCVVGELRTSADTVVGVFVNP